MKVKFKDMMLEGTPDEIMMFRVISNFEKKLQKDLEKQMTIEKKSEEKRSKIYSIFTKKEKKGVKNGRGKSINRKGQ